MCGWALNKWSKLNVVPGLIDAVGGQSNYFLQFVYCTSIMIGVLNYLYLVSIIHYSNIKMSYKGRDKDQFFPSKISCESIFPVVIFLSKWIFIKGWMLGCLSCVIWPHLPNQDASERKEGRLKLLRGKVPFTEDLGYHLIIFLMFINNRFLFYFFEIF